MKQKLKFGIGMFRQYGYGNAVPVAFHKHVLYGEY